MTTFPPFELFEVLIAAAEAKNYYEAGQRMGLSQGAISLKLQRLQDQVSLPIFTVRGRKKVLTQYGRELYEYAKRQTHLMRSDLECIERKYFSEENLSITVGCRRELLESLAPQLLFGGKVVHQQLSADEAVNALLSKKIDIAITYKRPNLLNIIATKVLESGAHLIVHKKLIRREFGKNFSQSRNFLSQVPCIIYNQDGHLLRQWIMHHGMTFDQLRPRLVAEDWRTLQILVDGGHGYAVVPDYVVPQSHEISVKRLSESVLPKFVFYAVFWKDLLQVPAFKRVIDSLKK